MVVTLDGAAVECDDIMVGEFTVVMLVGDVLVDISS
jgi:hypothetical protein